MSYSHLMRAPTSKEDYKRLSDQWADISGKALNAKVQANKNGTGAEVQPYLDRFHEIDKARNDWYSQYDATYNNLPD